MSNYKLTFRINKQSKFYFSNFPSSWWFRFIEVFNNIYREQEIGMRLFNKNSNIFNV